MWAEDHGLTRGQFLMLDHCARRMDEVYRTHFQAQQARAAENAKQVGHAAAAR